MNVVTHRVCIPATQTICVGDELFAFSNTKAIERGALVFICRTYAGRIGKPIAKAECLSCLGEEEGAQVVVQPDGKTFVPLMKYYRIRVSEVIRH